MSKTSTTRPGLLLIGGAIVGSVLAASGVLQRSAPGLGNEHVASVNGEYISKSEYLGYLDLLARDKRNPLSAADRRHVLDRIIEEKLLIERGLEIGLPFSDPRVRKAIVSAMIQTVTSDASSTEPDPEKLREFYQQNSDYFARPLRIQVRRMVFRGPDSQQRALAAHASLGSRDWDSVSAAMADKAILSLPASMLPVSKLNGYLGPALTDLALNLPIGGYSVPQADQAGHSIVMLVDLQRSELQPLAEVREQVQREFERRAGDDALRDYLDDLRAAAQIGIDDGFLESLEPLATTGA